MFGYDAIVVLPILLVLAAIGGLIAMAVTVYTEVISSGCQVCGVEFMGKADLKKHMLSHSKILSTKKLVSKKTFKKAA